MAAEAVGLSIRPNPAGVLIAFIGCDDNGGFTRRHGAERILRKRADDGEDHDAGGETRSLRDGAFALGGTRFDVSVKVVVPAALSGIVAAFLLAISRAVGETMIVALAAGGVAQITANPAAEVQTMTAYMVQIFLGDAPAFGVEYKSSYAVAATLFVMTFVLTMIGQYILRRFREEYD